MLLQNASQQCAKPPDRENSCASAASGRAMPTGAAFASREGAANVLAASMQTVHRSRLEHEIAQMRQPLLRQATAQMLSDLLQGKTPGFRLLKGTSLEPLAELQVDPVAGTVSVPDALWEQQRLRQCLHDIANTSSHPTEELPPPPDMSESLLAEMTQPMDQKQLQQTLEALHNNIPQGSPIATIIQNLLQLAHMEGPLRLIGPPSAAPVDLQTFSQHLMALANQLNGLHETKLMKDYMQSAHFKRSKYELFVLQHVQLLVWLERVQTTLYSGLSKSGGDMLHFVQQMGHAARVMLFQPMLLHGLQLVRYMQSLPLEEVPDSMARAMLYPPDSASESSRVEWLQLQLLLQFHTMFREALFNSQIYQPTYSPGEAALFNGLLRLEEIYTHLISRFPSCCPLSEQEQAVLTHMCTKISQLFNEGRHYKAVLETNPYGKGLMLKNQCAGPLPMEAARYAVRDWMMPFLLSFADLVKALWTLWTHLKRRKQQSETTRRAVESLARVASLCIVSQLDEARMAAASPHAPAAVNALAEPSRSVVMGGRMSAFAGFRDEARPDSTLEKILPTAQLPAVTPFSAQPNSSQAQPASGFVSAGQASDVSAPLPHEKQAQRQASDVSPPLPHEKQAQLTALPRSPSAAQQGQPSPSPSASSPPLHPTQQQPKCAELAPLLPAGGGAGGWASIVRKTATDGVAEAPSFAPPAPSKGRADSVGTSATPALLISDENVRAILLRREQARAARDFEIADKLREQLMQMGITLDDATKSWRSSDGRRSGSIAGAPGVKPVKSDAYSMSDEEINRLVKEREQARFTGDFKTADRLCEQLEKHGVLLNPKENKWLSLDGRSGSIGPVNISAAHAQKAARAGAPKMSVEEIEKVLVQREQARARRDYKTADVLREQLEKHGVYLDPKEKKWHSTDGRSGAIVISTLSNEEIGRVLANRQAARLRHDFKTADRLRDQLNEQGLSVDDKRNRWESSDGRSGSIDPFTSELAAIPAVDGEDMVLRNEIRLPKPSSAGMPKGGASTASLPSPPLLGDTSAAEAAIAAAAASGLSALTVGSSPEVKPDLPAIASTKTDRKKGLTEKERRELAKQLRTVTGASARLCEKALQAHADDMDRAADWLLSHGEARGGSEDGASNDGKSSDSTAGVTSTSAVVEDSGASPSDPATAAFVKHLLQQRHFCALVLSNAYALPSQSRSYFLRLFPATECGRTEDKGDIFYTPFASFEERDRAEAAVREVVSVKAVERCLPANQQGDASAPPRLLLLELSSPPPTILTEEKLRMVIERTFALQGQQQREQVKEAAQTLGVTIDTLARRWSTNDGRTGCAEPFRVDEAAETKPSEVPAVAAATKTDAAAATAALSDESVRSIVEHAVALHQQGQTQQASSVLAKAQVQCGLSIDLQARKWHMVDGREGSTEPFSILAGRKVAQAQNGTTTLGNGDAAAHVAPRRLELEEVKLLVEHLRQLESLSKTNEVQKVLEAVERLGLSVDLQSKRWSVSDGRSGGTVPFCVDSQSAKPGVSQGSVSGGADTNPEDETPLSLKEDIPGLPPPKMAMTPVSLAQVMKEQSSGKEGSPAATGMANPRGEYNCFLNVVIQTLWHVRAFREAVLNVGSSDELVLALQQVFTELSATEAAADEGVPLAGEAVSPEALRLALSAKFSEGAASRFQLRDMADATEAFEALLERLKEGSVGAASRVFEITIAEQRAGSSELVPYSTFVLYTSVAELRAIASPSIPLDEALRLVTTESHQGIEVRKTSVGALPEVFTLGFSWDTAKPTKMQLDTLLEQLEETIDLAKVLHGVDAATPATLCGVICYHASHYVAIVYDERTGAWLHCDDTAVSSVGTSWVDVRFKCHSCKYQPALVLYRQVQDNERLRSSTPLPALDNPNSWANMAVRCAAGGGILPTSAPSVKAVTAPPSRSVRNPTEVAAAAAAAAARTNVPVRSGPVAPPNGVRAQAPSTAALMKRGPGACHNCDDPSHESRDCPKPCRECGSDKHRIGFHYRTGIKTSKCFNCDNIGHESRDCPEPCGICGSSLHKSGYHLNDHLYEHAKSATDATDTCAPSAPARRAAPQPQLGARGKGGK